jgi:uncharacterized protein with beta-barrel porin domain
VTDATERQRCRVRMIQTPPSGDTFAKRELRECRRHDDSIRDSQCECRRKLFCPEAYTILSSSGLVLGRFDEVIDNRPSFEAEISYTPHKVIVTLFFDPLAAVRRPGAGGGAINQNQFNVLNAIVNSFNATGQIPVEFSNISTVHDLSELTGEVGTAVQQAAFNTMDRFLDTLLDPFLGERGGRAPIDSLAAYAPEDGKTAILRKAPPFAGGDVFPRWSQWATQYGGTQSTAGSPIVGSNDTRSNIFGVAAGADYRLLPDTLVGFGIGGAFTDFTVANGLGSGSDDSFQAGAYVRHSFGPAYVAAALAYGIHDLQTDRTVTILDELHAQFNAHTISGRAEVGYRYANNPWMGITPYAAGQSTTIFLPGRTEQSSLGATDPFVLSYAANDVTAPRSELGFRGDTSFVLGDSIVTCATASHGRTISTPAEPLRPLSSCCRYPHLSSMERCRTQTRRWCPAPRK